MNTESKSLDKRKQLLEEVIKHVNQSQMKNIRNSKIENMNQMN